MNVNLECLTMQFVCIDNDVLLLQGKGALQYLDSLHEYPNEKNILIVYFLADVKTIASNWHQKHGKFYSENGKVTWQIFTCLFEVSAWYENIAF